MPRVDNGRHRGGFSMTFEKSRRCRWCGVPFTATAANHQYCPACRFRDAYKPQAREPRVCAGCGESFTPRVNTQRYCTPNCYAKSRNPTATRYSDAEIRWLEEQSTENMAAFFMGTPHKKLPGAMRRRLNRLHKEKKKMDREIRPIAGFEAAPEVGHPVPVPSQGLIEHKEGEKGKKSTINQR